MASSPKAPAGASSKAVVRQNPNDPFVRGVYGTNTAGNATLIGLRALDPLLQYGILRYGWGSSLLHKLGLSTLAAGPPNTGTALDQLGLSPYRLILLAMATGLSIKPIAWATLLRREPLAPGMASAVAVLSTVVTSIGTLAFTTARASASLGSAARFPQTTLLVGGALYLLGLGVELVAEFQRKAFRREPANEGRLCTRGLWRYSRHPNYLGLTLTRVGFGVAASGWTLGGIFLLLQASRIWTSSIVVLEDYLSRKYGEQWQAYEKQTPYKFIPFVI